MRGAIHLGVCPTFVSARKAKLSYGVACCTRYNGSMMGGFIRRQKIQNGEMVDYIDDLWQPFNQIGESIGVDDERTYSFTPAWDNQQQMNIDLISCSNVNARSTTEAGMCKVGTIVVDTPFTSSFKRVPCKPSVKNPHGYEESVDTGLTRQFVVCMKFGTTEIQISVKQGNGATVHAKLDCGNFDLDGKPKIQTK